MPADEELVAGAQGLAQVGDEVAALEQGGAQLRLEDAVLPLARLLRRVHGDVGVAQQVVGAALPGEPGDPDAGAEADPPVPDLERVRRAPRPAARPAPRPRRRRGRRAAAAEQHDELVAAEPGDEVACAAGRDGAAGDLDEHQVADGVAGPVVDQLEAVEVEQEQRRARARGGGALQPLAEQGPVRQAGQAVGVRGGAQLALELDALGHVGVDAEVPEGAALLVAEHRRALLDVDQAAVLAGAPDRRADDRRLHQLVDVGLVLARVDHRVGAADHLVGPPAEDPLGGRVPEPDLAVEVELHDADRRALDQLAEPAQCLGALLVPGAQRGVQLRVLDRDAGLRGVHLEQLELLGAGRRPSRGRSTLMTPSRPERAVLSGAKSSSRACQASGSSLSGRSGTQVPTSESSGVRWR